MRAKIQGLEDMADAGRCRETRNRQYRVVIIVDVGPDSRGLRVGRIESEITRNVGPNDAAVKVDIGGLEDFERTWQCSGSATSGTGHHGKRPCLGAVGEACRRVFNILKRARAVGTSARQILSAEPEDRVFHEVDCVGKMTSGENPLCLSGVGSQRGIERQALVAEMSTDVYK